MIPKDHPALQGWTIFKENFTEEVTVSRHVEVSLYWGLDSIDKDGVNPWIPEFAGKILFDEQFNPASITSQNYLIEFCDVLRKSSLVSKDEPNESELLWCWPDDFKDFVVNDLKQ